MPLPFPIERSDVAEVESLLGCDFGSDAQLRALCHEDSVDIQAAPGSGKTTLLVAKLAILARKWTSRSQGVCVLSHTNVARQEVEARLAKDAHGRRLLGHPHFIGTFQAFAHQYLALPFLRGSGREPRFIDDGHFAAAIRARPKAWHINNYLQNHPATADTLLTTLRFEGPDLTVGCEATLPQAGTPTGRAFRALKSAMADDGYFRFQDMFAYASRAIRDVPGLIDVVRNRFPCVFIDEMQDTDTLQHAFVTSIFGDETVVQRFGDQNQAIFHDVVDADAVTGFPRAGYIDLVQSRRFGTHIARAASTITVRAPQEIQGTVREPEKRHTIFAFEQGAIGQVLPAFGDLLFEEYPDGFPRGFVAKAVAGRKTGAGQNMPRHLGDYWPPFAAGHAGSQASFSNLADYARRAQMLLTEACDCAPAADAIWDGLLALAHRGNIAHGTPRLTKRGLLAALDAADPAAGLALRLVAHRLCFSVDSGDADAWPQTAQEIENALRLLMLAPPPQAFADFLAWVPDGAAAAVVGRSRQNIVRHVSDDRSVEIALSTIHGVKGETHSATLVLSTPSRRMFDLKEAIGPLTGTGDARRRERQTVARQLTLVFVGMTRPSQLLCLAMPLDHLEANEIAALEGNGWRVHTLRAG
ncbi:hypothetical protein GGQ86_005233 [Xanthobacter flavus]|uniref:DNA 3'-5' helicase II n=2 Tax=Hyphomicrobiales TaxID=356 RepID=A0A7W9FN16_9HYPH|nr:MULTISPECIES: UvrD-helicase domain-containing protein [Hyphomicrobiales]MBB5753646.1 hypothetical protein [Prosthecomicrobium pneumaticum]MDR6336729.1 hypothetical protein [Xanthobacter flavus]GLI25334.1 hypothetical protein XFLAVUS301_50080 [Xanthobacter flavus]